MVRCNWNLVYCRATINHESCVMYMLGVRGGGGGRCFFTEGQWLYWYYNQIRAVGIHVFLALLLFCWWWWAVAACRRMASQHIAGKSWWRDEAAFNHWGKKTLEESLKFKVFISLSWLSGPFSTCQLKSYIWKCSKSQYEKKTSMFMVDVPLFTRGWNYGNRNPTPIKATSAKLERRS